MKEFETHNVLLAWPDGKRPKSSALSCVFAAITPILFFGGFLLAAYFSLYWLSLPLALGSFYCVWIKRQVKFDRKIKQQAAVRTRFPAEQWATAEEAELAEYLGRKIAEEFHWPNNYFLRDDPFDLIFYSTVGDGGEGMAIRDALKKERGVNLYKSKWHEAKTFGEFVDCCFALVKEQRGLGGAPT